MTPRAGIMTGMGMNEGSTPFRIELPPGGGSAVIEIDGVDVAKQVSGLRLEAASGRPTVLTLQGSAAGVIEGVGTVQQSMPVDPAVAISEFLAVLDPEELERVTLNRPDLGNEPAAVTRAMLRQLIEWATAS